MDPEINTASESVQNETPSVSFPSVSQTPSSSKKGSGKTVLVIALLILLAAVGFVIYKSSADSGEEIAVEETPASVLDTQPTSTPAPTASAAPVKKDTVSIKIQNGTGIPGEAAFLQDQLKALGYSDFEVGNATSQSETVTTVTYDKTLSTVVTDEITKKLKELYKEVEVKTATTATNDVVVITGLRKSQTAKPSATATPKASASASASAKPSTSPTATATPSN